MVRNDSKRRETGEFGSLVPMPRSTGYVIDEEAQYIGELTVGPLHVLSRKIRANSLPTQVSTFLEKHLGEAYEPNVHWTSHLRSRSGHMPYEMRNLGVSTFTVTEGSGTFTKFLTERGYSPAASWWSSPTYQSKLWYLKLVLTQNFSWI
jgi:hypothetical protein